jgi:uncharacterized protein YciI
MSAEFLYRIVPTRPEMLTGGPTTAEIAATQAHFAYLEAAKNVGVVLGAGRTLTKDESTFGLVIFRAPDEAAARDFMECDPAVQAGVMRAELFPFRVALWAARTDDVPRATPPPPARVVVPPPELVSPEAASPGPVPPEAAPPEPVPPEPVPPEPVPRRE